MNEKDKIMNRKCLFLTVSFLLLLLFVPMVVGMYRELCRRE